MTVATAKLLSQKKNMMPGREYKWFVVYTRTHHEKKLYEAVTRMNIESFLPLEKSLRYWAGRKKMIDLPLFPNYLFVRISNREYVRVLEQPSVISFIKNGNDLSEVPENIVDSIRKVFDERLDYTVIPGHAPIGTKVEVISGPMKGYRGEFIRRAGKSHLLIELKQINHSFLIKIDEKSIRLNKQLS